MPGGGKISVSSSAIYTRKNTDGTSSDETGVAILYTGTNYKDVRWIQFVSMKATVYAYNNAQKKMEQFVVKGFGYNFGGRRIDYVSSDDGYSPSLDLAKGASLPFYHAPGEVTTGIGGIVNKQKTSIIYDSPTVASFDAKALAEDLREKYVDPVIPKGYTFVGVKVVHDFSTYAFDIKDGKILGNVQWQAEATKVSNAKLYDEAYGKLKAKSLSLPNGMPIDFYTIGPISVKNEWADPNHALGKKGQQEAAYLLKGIGGGFGPSLPPSD